MANLSDGGGGFGGGFNLGVSNIAKSIKSTAKKSTKPQKKSVGSGMGKVGSSAKKSFNKVGSSVGKSYGNSYKSSSGGYGGNRGNTLAARPPAVARPPVGNTPGGTIARTVAPPPAPISVQDFISGDNTYQTQNNAYKKALADYAAQMRAEQGKYNGEYGAQVSQLGLDRTQSLEDLQNDYAGRGLLTSGVYADAQGDMNKKFDTSLADLARAKTAYMDDLTTGQTNFSATQKAMLDKAYQDALNRRLDQIRG